VIGSGSPNLNRQALIASAPTLGRRRRRRQALFIALCLLPTFILAATFNYYPLLSALYHSLFEWDGFSTPKFVGLQNFANLWSDPAIQASIKNMGILALSAVIITLTTPLIAAELVLATRNKRLFKVYRALLVVPIVVPQLVTLLLWSFMYDPTLGVINSLLSAIGLGGIAPQWLGDPAIAIYAIIGIGFPWIAGLNFLLYLAALQNIPAEIHDAGRLDGAVGFRRVILLDLPLITVQIRLLITLSLITVMQTFTSVWVLTQGGPGYATTVPGVVLYQQAFQFNNFGYASAIGAMIFLVTIALTVVSSGLGRLLSRERGA
jgi:raffinose/stachyose/melibiose transport system permease protein